MINFNVVVETIYYLLSKIGKTDKLKIVKLIFLADKCHLLRYGRTITNDDYYAMEMGPVGSTVKDVLNPDTDLLSQPERSKISELIEHTGCYDFKAKDGEYKIKMLSKSDEEVIDFIIKEFGSWSTTSLIEFVHKYPEWANHKELFENRRVGRIRIDTKELLSVIPGGDFSIPAEHIKISEEILLGEKD
jgi:uncharacterized phage-associated protein